MHDRRRPGMTLIELLVVVAVIAILASLLLPAIIQARGAGRKAQCESNLKQLAQAVQSFQHRNDRLPVYWGAMSSSGNKVGGWLLHMLPDLDQQIAFDSVPGATTETTSVVVPRTTVVNTGKMLPAIPPSDDYSPGVWKEIVIGRGVVNGVETTFTDWVLEGRKGTPGLPERPETISKTEYVTQTVASTFFGIRPEYFALGRQMTLPGLTDAEDIGAFRSPVTSGSMDASNQQLTNYQANAHVFMRFRPRITFEAVPHPTKTGRWGILLDGMKLWGGSGYGSEESAIADILSTGEFQGRTLTQAGLFNPIFTGVSNNALWQHSMSATSGPPGRSLNDVTDGLSNTILFAEGRRQCDNLSQYRAAFFPTGNPMHEHGFGIECQWRKDDGTLALDPNNKPFPTFGNTLMFQTMPTMAQTNPLRVQALHGNYLMVAMCDGSTRAISSLVSRREPIGVNASGRENFGTVFYSAESRGAYPTSPRPDGVWDMLMVPNDPRGNVLSNTGEIGREK
jgi:prepilin-type N-terminal cleavage/methylation domain-containing protein